MKDNDERYNPVAEALLAVLLARAGGTITVPLAEYNDLYQRLKGLGVRYVSTSYKLEATLDKL